MGIGIYLPYLLRFNLAGAIVGLFIAVFLFNVYVGAASLLARDIVDYKSTGIREFWEYVKEIWKSTIPLSVITGLQFAVIIIAPSLLLLAYQSDWTGFGEWTNKDNETVGSGIYFVYMKVGDYKETKKIAVVK